MLVRDDRIKAKLSHFRHNLRVVELLTLLKLRLDVDYSLFLPLEDLFQFRRADERYLDHYTRLAEVLPVELRANEACLPNRVELDEEGVRSMPILNNFAVEVGKVFLE